MIYRTGYTNSWALVIGVNQYQNAAPLHYACNDAAAMEEVLVSEFAFPKENIDLLTDADATRERIMGTFLEYANGRAGPDDRIVLFYAGHGHTTTGRRGQVGYLVPVDGSVGKLETLIRWDELTRNADLIPAKHVLFVMDACYGGLAVLRHVRPGSMRFLKDTLQRYSRQVLTAGKADETVADEGGPRSRQSVFTGHLLDALEGGAASRDGIITANRVMAYVYERVATDERSHQTPAYGTIDGEGDFVFDLRPVESALDESEIDKDMLVEILPSSHLQPFKESEQTTVQLVKQYLSEPRHEIALDDFVTGVVRKALLVIKDDDNFPAKAPDLSPEALAETLGKYEDAVRDLQTVLVLLARWGGDGHSSTVEKIFARLAEVERGGSGNVVWLALRWYPIRLLLYAGGVGALAGESYANLSSILTARIANPRERDGRREIIRPVVDAMLDVTRSGVLKTLPGYQRSYVPLSEYMLKLLQPSLEDLLFLGTSYEPLFDRFEVLFALIYADLTYPAGGEVWGPLGRYGWKYKAIDTERNPFAELVAEANQMENKWPPLASGLFQGSFKRFKQIAGAFDEFLKGLSWR